MPDATCALDQIPCGYLATNEGDAVVGSNALLREWLGYGASEAFPAALSTLLTSASALYLQLSVWPALQLGKTLNEVFLTFRAAGGEELPMLVNFRRSADPQVIDWALMQVAQRGRWEAEILRARQLAEQQSAELQAAKQDLERALTELKESNWLLRKAAEVLPTCMYCGNVKVAGETWDSALAYLRRNKVFLSHGCCPTCLPRMRTDMGLSSES
jgi:sigma-B regulation protein RsbU (phosphoserine phosphatase)